MDVIGWLLDSDPAIRWQVMRDLDGAAEDCVVAERARVCGEGWGARLLALQQRNGQWPVGTPAFSSEAAEEWWRPLGTARQGTLFPAWTSTTWRGCWSTSWRWGSPGRDEGPDVTKVRIRGQEYLLQRRMFRRLSTGQPIFRDRKTDGPAAWTQLSYPTFCHYDVLRRPGLSARGRRCPRRPGGQGNRAGPVQTRCRRALAAGEPAYR